MTVEPSDPVDAEMVPLRARGWAIPIALAVAVIAVVLGIGWGVGALRSSHRAETMTFVVPKGTSERALVGETIEIMPERVELDVGDTLVVRNEDTVVATIGPFTVRPGETLRQHFQQPQTLKGECTLSGSGEVQIVVT